MQLAKTKIPPWAFWAIAGALVLGGLAVMNLPRGIRNNNPGNIKEHPDDKTVWLGERATDDDPVFEEFIEMWEGVRALAEIILNYSKNHGLNTVEGIINRWAPPSENVTSAYVLDVAKQLNVSPSQPINVRASIRPLVLAIMRHENGPLAVSTYVRDSDIDKGVASALA